MISEDRQPPFFLGIDLGGTNIKSGVVDDAGRPFAGVSLETEAERGPEVGLRNIAEAGKLAVKASGLDWSQITAVGLGSPGTMDIHAGLLLNPPNLPGWVNLPIRERLSEMLGKPTVLQNDANAAAFGEYWSGAGRGAKSLVLFTLGTGIGCGIVDDGRIIEGRHSHGGECGHIIIQMEGGAPALAARRGTSRPMLRRPRWSNGRWKPSMSIPIRRLSSSIRKTISRAEPSTRPPTRETSLPKN